MRGNPAKGQHLCGKPSHAEAVARHGKRRANAAFRNRHAATIFPL
jgi:hypothetical protein